MVHRNIVLASTIASIIGIPSLAHAKLEMSSTTPTSIKFASEIGDATLQNKNQNLTVSTKLLKEIPGKASGSASGVTGDEKFIRFDLTGGDAEFGAIDVDDLSIVAASYNGSLVAGGTSYSISLSAGGDGHSYVIYSIKNTCNTEIDIDAASVIEFSPSNVKVGDSDENVSVTYSIYRTALDSVSESAAPLDSDKETYLEFSPAFTFSATVTTPLTADVESDFEKFTDGNVGGKLATLTAKVKTDLALDDTSITSISNMLQDAELTVTGDFSSLADDDGAYSVDRIFITSTDDCTVAYAPTEAEIFTTSSLTAEKAIIQMPASTADSEKSYYLCINRDENSSVVYKAAEYSLDFNPNAETGLNIPEQSGLKAGSIERDGTVLDTPYFTLDPSSISRVILSNFGQKDAAFTVKVQSDEGNVVTPGTVTEGTITANTILQIKGSELASFSTKQRGSAKFTIVAPPDTVSGVYQTVNNISGAVTSIKLIHEGGNH